MKTSVFVRRSLIEAPAEAVFRWHARPGAFERLAPPWEPVEILERTGGIDDGARTVLRVRLGPLRRRWVAEHRDYVEGRQFRDVQVSGPFAHWDHLHRIEPDGPDRCHLEDRVEYALPLGPVGRLLGAGLVRRKLEATFAYRHRTTILDLAAHRAAGDASLRRVLVSGDPGLVGSALVPFLTTGGHEVTRLGRLPPGPLDPAGLEGHDAVVHLPVENLVSGRWRGGKRGFVHENQAGPTRRLCEALARLSRPPRVLVCGSSIGSYGSRGDETLDEQSAPGTGWLAAVCRGWEEATEPARARGIRVVLLRLGTVLSPAGGVLRKLLVPFRLGAASRLGDGRQFVSWISLDDAIGAIHHALLSEHLEGPVNAVAPRPLPNREFARTLGRVLRRLPLVPLPAFALRLRYGPLADETLLASTRVEPRKLLATGYAFRDPDLEEALRFLLGKMAVRRDQS